MRQCRRLPGERKAGSSQQTTQTKTKSFSSILQPRPQAGISHPQSQNQHDRQLTRVPTNLDEPLVRQQMSATALPSGGYARMWTSRMGFRARRGKGSKRNISVEKQLSGPVKSPASNRKHQPQLQEQPTKASEKESRGGRGERCPKS